MVFGTLVLFFSKIIIRLNTTVSCHAIDWFILFDDIKLKCSFCQCSLLINQKCPKIQAKKGRDKTQKKQLKFCDLANFNAPKEKRETINFIYCDFHGCNKKSKRLKEAGKCCETERAKRAERGKKRERKCQVSPSH